MSQQAVLKRFEDQIPHRPYCANDFPSGIKPRSREVALEKWFIQPNHPAFVCYLPFDIDRPYAGAAWLDGDLPEPTLTLYNQANGHAHLLYELAAPVCDSPANPKPMRYLKAIQYAYTERLEADRGYYGLLTKNPLRWPTRCKDVVYTLSDLAKHVELVPHYQRKPANDLSVLGRNCTLFEQARYFAYEVATKYDTEKALLAAIEKFCYAHNLFPIPLPFNEVKSIAKSVSKWTWKHRHDLGARRRLLQLDRALPLSARQAIGAAHTHRIRRKSTEERIIDAIGKLTVTGKRATKAEASRMTGITDRTLKRYSRLFRE